MPERLAYFVLDCLCANLQEVCSLHNAHGLFTVLIRKIVVILCDSMSFPCPSYFVSCMLVWSLSFSVSPFFLNHSLFLDLSLFHSNTFFFFCLAYNFIWHCCTGAEGPMCESVQGSTSRLHCLCYCWDHLFLSSWTDGTYDGEQGQLVRHGDLSATLAQIGSPSRFQSAVVTF